MIFTSSQSVGHTHRDRQTDDEELQEILEACELPVFEPEVARVFENAIERLFYSESFRIGNATLPQNRVRSRLHLLDRMILDTAKGKLRSNLGRQVKNSTAYESSTASRRARATCWWTRISTASASCRLEGSDSHAFICSVKIHPGCFAQTGLRSPAAA